MGCLSAETIGCAVLNRRNDSQNAYVDNMLKSILDPLFPQFCIGCKKLGEPICSNCMHKINNERIDFPLCLICENLCSDGKTHLICSTKTKVSKYFSAFAYMGISKRILQSKSKNPLLLKNLVRAVNISDLTKIISEIDMIIPIPPSPRYLDPRMLEPVDVISKELSHMIKSPVHKVLFKPLLSKQQKKLNLINRRNPSIRIQRDSLHLIRGKRILLVDDVCTTGATINAASALLKQFGATRVDAYTLARDLRYN